MDNFDLRKYLVENKATTNSRMLNEYFPKDTRDVAEAFREAGINMDAPVEVIEAGSGGPGGYINDARTMDPKVLLQQIEKEKAEDENEGGENSIHYDFEVGDSWPEYPDAKLSVGFGDSYEYIIIQKD